jgi:hypothetical protein
MKEMVLIILGYGILANVDGLRKNSWGWHMALRTVPLHGSAGIVWVKKPRGSHRLNVFIVFIMVRD